MKKVLFSLLAGFISIIAVAQTDSLQEYTGKFKFGADSPVAEIAVSIENGVLWAVAAEGSSELTPISKDVFEIVAYGGLATYVRNEAGKISGLKIELDGTTFEGKKQE